MSLIHCERCGRNTKLLAKGLCSKCYHYLHHKEQLQGVCVDCEKKICRESMRCLHCAGIAKRKANYHCIDCVADVYRGSLRCRECHIAYTKTTAFKQAHSEILSASWEKRGKQPKSYCIDCGQGITRGATRCQDCFKVYMKTPEWGQLKSACVGQYYETHNHVMKGKSLPKEWCLNIGEAKRQAWRDGVYDGVFKSPSQPEADLLSVLDELGIEYISQYRLETYPYDAYLPAYKILVEYDGWHWHNSDWAIEHGFDKRDERKDELAEQLGFTLVRLLGYPRRDLTRGELRAGLVDAIR